MEKLRVNVKSTASDLPLPQYHSASAAGVDLRAAIEQDFVLEPGKRTAIPTGLHVAVPQGYEAQVRPRSGLAFKHGISMVNGVGTIDSDYRGEIKVLLINHGEEPFVVSRGDRIAQLIFNKVAQAEFEKVEDLDETDRGEGGFGSTGVQ